MEFAVRRCVAGDETALSIVAQGTVLETYAGISEGPDVYAHVEGNLGVEAFREVLAAPHTRAWLAEAAEGRCAVGYAVALPERGDPAVLELLRLYVFYRFHGLGIGVRLLREVLECARERHAVRISLRVRDVNERAIAFYERNGFRTTGEEFFRAGANDYHVFVMEHALEPAAGRG